ncbi:MAG TPA: glycosyltransferase [Polyangiaceae bacterium]|nr:glycosyltransferase [Polyangiaceae bacterium]
MTLKVLVVAYAFPPVGGAGVQRMLKLVKYLPEHDVLPSVLTVARPSVPVMDASLLAEVPKEVAVLRAPTLEPSYSAKDLAWRAHADAPKKFAARPLRAVSRFGRELLVPDPQVLWLPGAARSLLRRLRGEREDVVLISGPPFSQFLLAPLADRLRHTPYVLDYRDEWTTTSSVYEMSGSARAAERLERAILRRASVVTTATEEFRENLLARFDFLDPERTLAIPNGYDPADFPDVLPSPPSDRCLLTYTGTVFRLTSARGFLSGVRLLHEREPVLARRLETRFVGRIVETEADAFEDADALGVRRFGYLPHAEALRLLAESHVPLCLLADLPGSERIYPAKIFEIMRLGRRALVLTPEGALARLVRRHRLGDVVPPGDAPAVAAALERLLRAFVAGTLEHAERPLDTERFDRRHLAGEFARALELACGRYARAG